MIPSESVATSYQCLRTYISGLPWRHLPVSRQVRNTAWTVMVRPHHTNLRGKPGSPNAMRSVSAVSVMGIMGSLMNFLGIVDILQGNPHSVKPEPHNTPAQGNSAAPLQLADMEPQCPGQLTPIPAGPSFEMDCRDRCRCRESSTIRFRHHGCLLIRGGLFPLLLAGHPFLTPAERGLFNVRTFCTVQSIT